MTELYKALSWATQHEIPTQWITSGGRVALGFETILACSDAVASSVAGAATGSEERAPLMTQFPEEQESSEAADPRWRQHILWNV